jgi:hypothetical protein
LTNPPSFTSGPASNYAGVVPLGEPSEAAPAGPPIPKVSSKALDVIAAILAVLAAVATVVSTLLPYEVFDAGPNGSGFTVSSSSWQRIISPTPPADANEGGTALYGIPYSLAAMVLLVSAGLLLGAAGAKGRRIARLTITAGATAVLAMFAMVAAETVAFVGLGEAKSAKENGILYESGPGVWGFLIVALLAVGAAVLALLPATEDSEADMATPPMGFPMPQPGHVAPPAPQAPQALQPPQVAEIPEPPASK